MHFDIHIQLLGSEQCTQEMFEAGKSKIKELVKGQKCSLVFDSKTPSVLVFLTGGTELQALEIIKNSKEDFFLLIGMEEQNGYASATETKAYLQENGILNWLSTYGLANKKSFLTLFGRAIYAKKQLVGKRLGILGEPSSWLIASNSDKKQLAERTGIELFPIKWNEVEDYTKSKISKSFSKVFDSKFDDAEIEKASKVHTMLKNCIKENSLDAITVECFPMVVKNSVTSCLSLGLLNSLGKTSGCEGDTTSAAGMMIVKELTNKNCWMANLTNLESERAFFSHCSVPLNLVGAYSIKTHFETDKGTAIAGNIKARAITIFRLNKNLNKAFIAKGSITKNLSNFNNCRTQIEVKMPAKNIRTLKRNPLGNHHLIIPGDYFAQIRIFCLINSIELVISD